MMRVLLVCKSKSMENLGVMYLSAVLKQCDCECKIVSLNEAKGVALKWEPQYIGYSIMTGDQAKFMDVHRSVVESWGNKEDPPVSIAGGPHPTFFPNDCRWANFIIKGEAESLIMSIIDGTSESPVSYKTLDDIPWPDRTDFPGMRVRDFIASRGCPNACSYCFNDQWNKMFPDIPKVRQRSVNDVIEEINAVDPEYVYFQDSCFGVSLKWMREFSVKYRAKINIPFQCHLRPNQINEERVLLLHDCNCASVRIALESASNRMRAMLNRGKMALPDVKDAVTLIKKFDMKVMLQNMIGLPDGTIEDDLFTLEFNIRCKPTYAWVSIFTPYPGTEMGKWCVENKWWSGNCSEIGENFFDKSVLNFNDEYKEQLECLQKLFALCVETGYLPEAWELTYVNFPKLVHKIMRWQGDKRLYLGIL